MWMTASNDSSGRERVQTFIALTHEFSGGDVCYTDPENIPYGHKLAHRLSRSRLVWCVFTFINVYTSTIQYEVWIPTSVDLTQ